MFISEWTWWLLGLCVLASCGLSFFTVWRHRSNFSQPIVQRKVISILWMVPIYSVEAWLSLRLSGHGDLLDLVRDTYEAYVIYIFFSLCITYIGQVDHQTVDPIKVIAVLQEQRQVVQPAPFNRCFKPVNLLSSSHEFLTRCKRGVLQFVVVKPLCSALSLILSLFGDIDMGEINFGKPYVYVALVNNVSVSVSLYYLVFFYVATKDALRPHQPLAKFICIKLVIFFSWWQSVALAFACGLGLIVDSTGTYNSHELSTSIQSMLIVLEMLVISFFHTRVFGAGQYRFGANRALEHGLSDVLPFGQNELTKDLREVAPNMMPQGLRAETPSREHRLYVPPATDHSPLPSRPPMTTSVDLADMSSPRQESSSSGARWEMSSPLPTVQPRHSPRVDEGYFAKDLAR